MIIFRVSQFPQIGKVGELRAHLEENVKQSQADGVQTSLSQKVVSDSEPALEVNRLFENLEAFEKFRDQSSSGMESRRQEVAPLIRQPANTTLSNGLVPPSGENAPRRYAGNALVYPALGKGPLVRSILTEFVRSYQAERPYASIAARLLSSQGAVFVFRDSFETLAEFENIWVNNPSASLQAAAAQVTSLSRAPIVQELYEFLVPFKS